MDIKITEDMKVRARDMEQETLRNLHTPENYTKLYSPEQFYVGYLGELVFERYLLDRGKHYKYDPICDGNSAGADFFVEAHRTLSTEVKTSNNPAAQRLMIPEAQYNHRKFDIYIGVHLLGEVAKLYGFCLPSQLVYAPEGFTAQKVPTYYTFYQSLRPLEQLKLQ